VGTWKFIGAFSKSYVRRKWLAQSSPPDKFTSKSRSFDRNSSAEKDRELPKAAKGFFLVQGIAVER
jgi:hypothetical protein